MGDVYLDTSFLLKLYVLERETPVARAHLQLVPGSAVVSSLSDVEVIAALSRRLSVADAAIAKAKYRANRVAGLFVVQPLSQEVFERAIPLADAHAKLYKLKSLDILHLATALYYRIATIGTFDKDMKTAALALGLAVLPA